MSRPSLPRLLSSALLAVLLLPTAVPAQKAAKPEGPRVVVAAPLGVVPGVPVRLTLRGLKLDEATAVQFHEPKARARLLDRGKAPPPNQQEPARAGDTQLTFEVTLPPDLVAATVSFVVATPAGVSPPHLLQVDEAPPLAEKEGNDGFRQAQPLPLGQTVEGGIGQALDVDVYRVEGQAGQALVCEGLAARLGSALDAVLVLYDAAGQQVAASDDALGADARLEVVLPRPGPYYLCVLDAHDQGGPAHVYRLAVRAR